MKALDRKLRRLREDQALQFVRDGDRLLDVGCFDRALLDRALPRVARAVGIDPLVAPARDGKVELVRGLFPGEPRFADGSFDCITCLAVLEHVQDPGALARECARLLAPGGRVALTVPSPIVDRILDVLILLRLADGMSAEEHHGFDAGRTPEFFRGAGLELAVRRRFELGLNQLFVFEKPRAGGAARA